MDNRTVRIITKPWGEEQIYAENEKYIGKILCIKAGHRLSKQYHIKKDETLYLLEGKVNIEYTGQRNGYFCSKMHKGYIFRIFPGVIHRLEALEDSKVLEVSTGEGDDVVRLEDDYRRPVKIS